MALRGCLRRTAAALTALVALAGVAACSQDAPPAPPPAPLRILLVNDDGWNAPGIVSLRQALQRAGHRVVEVAPVADAGSAGTGATFTGEFRVRRPTPDRDLWTVTGTASDATLVGLRSIMGNEWPDLVISGINSQRSVGLDAMRSGTVGAALTAAGLDFPAVAVSADLTNPRPRPAEFARAADFTVRLVATMQRQQPEGAPLMSKNTVLNVNYPGGPKPPRGVIAVPTADVPSTTVFYRYGRNLESYVVAPTPAAAPGGRDEGEGSDIAALSGGRVTLTDFSADPDRSAPPARVAPRLAPLLTP